MWPKFLYHHRSRGEFQRDHPSNLPNRTVSQEYSASFRTNSYSEMWIKVQGLLRRTNEEHSPFSPLPSYIQIAECLIQPPQNILLSMINKSHLHDLVLDYFSHSFEACKTCGLLLESVYQTRANYDIIQRLINATNVVSGDYADEQCHLIIAECMKFETLENPLSGSNQVQFRKIHELFGFTLKRLTSKRNKVRRRAKVFRICKKTLGICLIVSLGGLAVAAIVLAAHSCVGIAATPIVITTSTTFLKRKFIKRKFRSVRRLKLRSITRLSAQMDAATWGAYKLNRYFDTMSRIITRLNNEFEHIKNVISICLRIKKRHLLEKAMEEFENNVSCFVEQLDELEKHVYLCFLAINRGRELLLQEIFVHQQHL
ncbi:UPF0496 protein At1g20180-like [Tasmannia lanceolata]|uniref:UPF0496 protein At1g20180-like n=1 Tax=Tasmannia lanceolata TaxID=3420 RepID=UPI0040642D25